jgi:subtilisin family serine protease
MESISAKEVDPGKPRYLVVFRKASKKNTSTLSTVLKRGKAEGYEAREGISMLASGDSGVDTKVFENLGVAAADLTDAQYHTLCDRPDVIDVVENEVRFLPPQPEETPESGAEPEIIAYLKGMRDAANMAIAFHEGRDRSTALPGISENFLSGGDTTWGIEAIGLADAENPPTGRGVKVAVLDTGIDLTHPDMGGKVIEGITAVSKVTGISVQDVNGHGTHCAGVVCGPLQSSSGKRYGVAPDAELLVGKVFNNDNKPKATDDDILEGITWAELLGARIISMSLGSKRLVNGNFPIQYEAVVQQLLNRSENSVLLIAAAGNASLRPMSTAPVENPASCPSIMAVAAIDKSRNIANFSCRKMDEIGIVDLSAPGVDVFSSFKGGGFRKMSGTSMATPFTAGLAALYLERDPSLTAAALFIELKNKARHLGNVKDFGAGLIQL